MVLRSVYKDAKQLLLGVNRHFPPQISDKWIAVLQRKASGRDLAVAEEMHDYIRSFLIVNPSDRTIIGSKINFSPNGNFIAMEIQIFLLLGPHFTKFE